jgi:hypothetical protein
MLIHLLSTREACVLYAWHVLSIKTGDRMGRCRSGGKRSGLNHQDVLRHVRAAADSRSADVPRAELGG